MESIIKVYLDDERKTPEGWIRTFWPDEVIELLKTNQVVELSLDHDLGDDVRGTGYDVLSWIEEQVICFGFKPPILYVHSANVSAKKRMLQAIESIDKFYRSTIKDNY